MDKELRGVIEESIDNIYENQSFLETVNWILDAEVLDADDIVLNKQDFALGYFLGSLMNILTERVRMSKVVKESDRRLQRTLGKERAGKITEGGRKAKARSRVLKTEITQEETEQIRNILTKWIRPFRVKIRKEMALRGLR